MMFSFTGLWKANLRLFLLCLLGSSNLASALRVYGVSPWAASLAGGGKVIIYGSGFSADQYEGANRVFIGDIPCDVDWFNSAKDRLVCWIRPWPDAVEGKSSDNMPVQVFVGQESVKNGWVRYWWWRTARVEGVVPRSSIPRTVVNLKGWFVSNDAKQIQTVLVGKDVCGMYKPGSSELYRENELDAAVVKCLVASLKVGFYNASVLVPDFGGWSWNHSRSLQPGPSGQLYMYELHPDVINVYPTFGSLEGGTLLRVRGSGFGNKVDMISVDVDGVLCEVQAVTNDLVTCITGPAPPHSAAIQGINGSFPLEYGIFFEGARGSTMKVWTNIAGTSVSDLIAADGYPNLPDVFYNIEDFASPLQYGDIYGVVLEAFFTAHHDSLHTFYFASNDNGELWFANTTNSSEARLIASVPTYALTNQYTKHYSEQISDPVYLTKGQKCYLKALAKEHDGSDFVKAAVLVHNPGFEYISKQTKSAVPEHQQIFTTATVYNEIQSVTVNYSQSISQLTSAFHLKWSGRQSSQLDVQATNEDVRQAVLGLFEGQCTDASSSIVDSYDIDTFEEGEKEWWNSLMSKARPNIVYSDAYCGRKSLEVVSGYALNFDGADGLEDFQDEFGYSTTNYPYVCMAYRIPSGTHAALAVNIEDRGWHYVPLTEFLDGLPFTLLTNWEDVGGEQVRDDNKWHYSCFDLDDAVKNVLGFGKRYRIIGVGFASPAPLYRNGPFYIDEFSISSDPRNLQQTSPPARPNGLVLSDVQVSNMTASHGDSNSTTFLLEYKATTCFANYSLIEAVASNQARSQGLHVLSHVVRNASSPIKGTFRLGIFNQWTPEIPHDANWEEVKTALESIPEVGEVTVHQWLRDGNEACKGRGWNIFFYDIPSDMPLMMVNSSLQGENVNVHTKEFTNGGILFDPIPGYMLSTVERTPQVRVTVNGMHASCQGSGQSLHATRYSHNTSCQFAYSHDAQPVVTSLSPESGFSGDVITIVGTGFESNIEEYVIHFGTVPCKVRNANRTVVQCVTGDGHAGPHQLRFRIVSLGKANTTGLSFKYKLSFSLSDPLVGSIGGGLVATLNGRGFLYPKRDNQSYPQQQVLFNGKNCTIVSSNFSELHCIVPAGISNGTVNVSVVVVSDNGEETSYTAIDAFTYSDLLTPHVESVNPNKGSAAGGIVVTITGSGFSTVSSENSVKIGSVECMILFATNETITCETEQNVPGTYHVVVVVAGSGSPVVSLNFTYELRVDDFSHFEGSVFGGQRIHVTGAGFGTNSSLVNVQLGDNPCDIEYVTNDLIQCVTRTSSITHHVDNLGHNLVCGLGHQWCPQHVTIQEGDSVEWKWSGSPQAIRRSVAQVEDENTTEYNGFGFRSEPSIDGHFSQAFDVPGVYHYVSEGHGQTGFRGSVTVTTFKSKLVPITVTVNGISATHTSNFVNSSLNSLLNSCDNDTEFPLDEGTVAYYMYSSFMTPVIEEVIPAVVGLGDQVIVKGLAFADKLVGNLLNTLTIGGKACLLSDNARMSDKPSSNVTTLNGDVVGFKDAINCTVPKRPPGIYRVVVHVAGRGWGFGSLSASTIEYQPAFSVDVINGSVYGGREVTLSGVGFHPKASLGNNVKVGNTVCDVQSLTDSDEWGNGGSMICITRRSFNDGYAAVVKENRPLGYWQLNTRDIVSGLVLSGSPRSPGTGGDGSVYGNIEAGVDGISGNNWTNSAIRFNASWISVPYVPELNSSSNVSGELWLKWESNAGAYQLVLGAYRSGIVSHGYALWINPCGEVEYWLAVDATGGYENSSCVSPDDMDESDASGGHVVVANIINSCGECNGTRIVSSNESGVSGLPTGVWSVITGPQLRRNSWAHVVFSWLNDSSVIHGIGVQALYVDGVFIENRTTNFSCNFDQPLLIGGQSMTGDSSLVGPFVGVVDEVALYGQVLDKNAILKHYHYGSTEEQPVGLYYEMEDHRGEGTVPNVKYPPPPVDFVDVTVNWTVISTDTIHVNTSDRLQFVWNGFHSVVQVSVHEFNSCTENADEKRIVWGLSHSDGIATVVGLESGLNHYFISDVNGDCEEGHKLMVFVGSEYVIDWRLGEEYSPISIPHGTGLRFQWSTGPGVFHDVVELASKEALEKCTVGQVAEASGSVVDRYSNPLTTGNVTLTGLGVGTHYFACAVSGHCALGMQVVVTVTGDDTADVNNSHNQLHQTVHIRWHLTTYLDIMIMQGDSVVFVWEEFHSLSQVSKHAYDECDVSSKPLKEWSQASIPGTVTVSGLAPGTYYFTSTVSGECTAGMKVAIVVNPRPNVHIFGRLKQAKCLSQYCSYSAKEDQTPVLLSIEPDHGAPGTTITIVGIRLLNQDFGINSLLSSVLEVRIGNALCRRTVQVLYGSDNQTIKCVIPEQEAGDKNITVLVYGAGFSSLRVNVFDTVPKHFFHVDAVVTEVTPTNGSIAGGTQITLTGHGFSVVQSHSTVQIGGYDCDVIDSSVDKITCVTSSVESTPDLHDSPLPVSLFLGNSIVNSSAVYTYSTNSTPVITNVTRSVVLFGDIISISGVFYTGRADSVEVYISRKSPLVGLLPIQLATTRQECEVESIGDSEIRCVVGPRVAGDRYVVMVKVKNIGYALVSPKNAADVVYQLQVETVTPTSFGLGGGVEVTLKGSGFLSGTLANEESDFHFKSEFSFVDTQKEAASAGQALVAMNLRGKLVSSHGIDYGVTYVVTVCGQICYIQSSTYNTTVCVVPQSQILSDVGNVADRLNAIQSCAVEAVINGSSGASRAQLHSNVTYRGSFTPYINSVSPRRGGTAGGTILTITGLGFNSSIDGAEVIVTINGVECSLRETTDSVIKCRTDAHKTTVNGRVFVVVPGKGSAIELDPGNATSPSSAQFEYVDRWSSRFTWGGNDPPGDGASVYIQAGQTVLLDTSPSGVLSLLVIDGTLIFDDNQDIYLQSKYIFINGGRLQIGTSENPFMHKAVITLHGNVRDPEIPVYGAKVLALRRGSLEMHGRPRNTTWTQLAKTVMKNESVLELMEPVDWMKDDVIVIASTSKDGNETEMTSISSVENDGYKIVLCNPVNFTHYGITDVLEDGQFIDIRAEVGLLSHNIIVQGSQYVGDSIDDLGADQFGSHIMIFRPKAEPSPIQLEHVEVRHGGQAFRLGRYAVHFHLSDQMNGSYVRHCSIHHSHNRAITAHGVHDMLFEGVVAYDIRGHTFFIEDGIETGNRYIRNLGLLTRGSSSLLNTDQIPATFWITNPNNTFIGNAAAGSRAYGFWYDLDPHPSGPSFTRTVCPNQTPIGEFRDNIAHTNAEFGFRIWETYIPKEFGCSGDDVAANFYNLVAYSNGINGVELSVIGNVRLIGFKVADNRDEGIVIQESFGSSDGPMIKDTLIVSHSIANQGSPQISGIRTPSRRVLTISNVTFARFDDPSLTCLRACSHCKFRQGGFQYRFEKITYLSNSSLHRTAFQWEHEVLFKDLDGTLAGVPGGWVTPTNGLLPPEYCQQRPEYSVNAAVPGSVCTSDVQLLRFAWNNAEPLATLSGRDVLVSNGNASTLVPWRKKRLTHPNGYMVTLPSQRVHNLSYVLPPNLDIDNTAYSAELFDVPVDESVIIQSYYHTVPNHFRVGSNRKDIGRELQFSDNHTSWHFNNETLQLQYILSAKGRTANLSDLSYSFSKEPCPVEGCPAPSIGNNGYESRWRRWSVSSDWPNNQVPLPGANVTINSSWRMYVDVAEVNVEKLEIQGILQFEDTRDIVFNATWILIIGNNSKFIVGQESSPFQHEAIIYLKGNRRTPDLVLSRRVIVGSKAIGVLGELHLIGKRHNVMWTRLNQSAMAGDTKLHVESSSVDWKTGEEIVLAPSGYFPSEAEIITIQSIIGNVVSLLHPLQYNHTVDRFLTGNEAGTGRDASRWWHGNGGVRVAAEVGILSQNVRVIGEEDKYNSISVDEFGCRVLVGYYQLGRSEYTGKAFIDGVQFKHCGQGGFFSSRDPRYVVAFKNGLDGMAGSYVKHSSVHTGFNTAFGTLASNFIEFSNNVVYHSVDSMFKISSLNCNVSNNLGVLTRSIQVARPKDGKAVDFPATYRIRGTGNTVKNNVAAGSERVGFYFPGESCVNGAAPDSANAKFWGNAAHTGMMGLVITGLNEPCSAAGGFVTARQWEYGVFSSTASRVSVRELAVAVGHTGLCLNIFGPDPVTHLVDYKWITVDDSLVVGGTEQEPCFTSKPAYCPEICSDTTAPKLGIMMATFAKKRSKMDGSGPWHRPKSYPTIAGQVNITSVTFARFKDYGRCSHPSYVIANNRLSPDAMHPNYFENTGLIDVESDRIAHLYPPNPAWRVQEDCIDMDCDGPKHSVVHDVDGKLVQATGKRGSIIPEAEIRFDPSRLPEGMLYTHDDPTTRLDPNTLIDKRGIARGEDGSFDGSSPGCLWVPSWNAYKCSGLNHHMLVIESMDADSEVRRVSPIVLHGGDTGFGTYTDLMNGPMDHGWCTHYTCLKRLSAFFSIVALGTDYQLWFTGTNPGHLRFHLLNTDGGEGGEGVRLSIWYKNPQRKDIYKSGVYVEADNAVPQPGGRVRRPNGDQYIPNLDSSDSGANYFDRSKQTLHLVIKGGEPVEVQTPPVVQVSLDLAVSLDDFFDPDSFVQNLAFVLGIDENTIRVVDVIAEDTSVSKRRRRGLLAKATELVQMVIEIGDPPATNISQPQTPSIEEQSKEGGGLSSDSVDTELDNKTDTTTVPPTASSAITANGEQVPSKQELLAESEENAQKFMDDTAIYLSLVQKTNHVNNILNAFVNEIQTGKLQFENVTVTSMTVAPAPPPPKPVKPIPPPGFDNLTTSDGEPIYSSIDVPTSAALLIAVESNDTEIVFQVPAEAAVSREPPVVSGHLVYVSVVVLDASGNSVEKLGLSEPWECSASLIYNGENSNPPVLEGTTTVSFHNGYADFTRLRVDRAADNLQLSFVVSPSGFTVRTTTSFSVVPPDISSTDHIIVSFSFDGSYEDVVTAGPGGKDGFLEALKEYLAVILDVDKSRLIDLKVLPGSILCSMTILDRADTDPADVPTLLSTVDYLERLVEAGQLTITHGSYNLSSDRSSFHIDKNDQKDSESFPVWAIVLIAVVSGLIVVMLLVLYVKIHRSGSGKKSQKKVHPDERWADARQPLQTPKPSDGKREFQKDVPMTEIKHHTGTVFIIENTSTQETQWMGPVHYAPPPAYDRDLTPVESATCLLPGSPRVSPTESK